MGFNMLPNCTISLEGCEKTIERRIGKLKIKAADWIDVGQAVVSARLLLDCMKSDWRLHVVLIKCSRVSFLSRFPK